MTYNLNHYTDYNTPEQWKPHVVKENNNNNIDTDNSLTTLMLSKC